MGKSRISLSLVSAFIVFSVLWTPAYTDDKCSLGCKGSSSGPTFLNGHKYNYAVEGVVSIYLTGADKQETSVKLLGQVSVSAIGNCAHVLKVQNLVISGPDGKKYSKPPGLEKPVRFTLQDGHIGSDICTEEGDTRRSLNIKRAIISLLQNGQKSGTEVDVFGACPTEISSSKEGGAVLLHRSRDLSRCGFREHGKNDLITAVYNPQAEIKNTQVLQSNLNIESKLNNGVPEKVSAIEEHLYKPFSVGENGARAKVHTKLTLTGQAAGADTGAFTEARTIIFENPHGAKLEQSNLQSALTAVKETATTLNTEASSKSAGTFAQLVRILRSTNKDDLLKVYSQIKSNNLERRVFLDGLLRAGTGYSIEASVQLLKTKELLPLEQKVVFLSLGNARHVNDEAITAAATLLDIPNIPKEVYLGVGALGSAYCRSHNCHSGKSAGVIALSQKLGAKLNCKAKGKVNEDNTVAILKGIRNIRHLEDSLLDKLQHCASDNNVKARVRVAALEAFQADPCTAKLKKAALDLMKNRQQDSEIRIKAYLAVIACPCGKSANEIKNLLETEPVHQVGRFITTSLRHIRASSNPDKQLAKHHYGLIRTPNKFNVDDRKYSYYREASYNVDALGIGGSLEQTVIFSQDSFLPRSVSFNLTAEVFGHNLNVFEIGGRQGNLDRVVEHFLGPKSFLRTDDPQGLYDDLVQRFTDTQKKVDTKIRGRRSVKSDVDKFDKQIKAEAVPFDNELDLDIYLKLFGTDALFLSLGDDKGFDYNALLDQALKHLDTGINEAKRFQQEIRSHLLFLDAELAYATSTGLPLKLNLIGAATGRLDVATNIDLKQILRDPKNAKVDIKLVPSSDIEISGLFLVDADAVATGIKVVTNLHSSTGGHAIAKVLENGQGFDLQFELPVDKQEIVTASNDLVVFTTEKGQKEKHVALKTDSDKKDYSGCFDQLTNVIGLTLCGEVSVPFSVSGPEAQASLQKFFHRYPLTGSTKLKLQLEKNDLRGYHVKGLLKTDNNEKKSFELLFEAQGSKNRKTALTAELINTNEEKGISLALQFPIKTLEGKIALLTKPNEYAAVIKAKVDAEEYFGRVGFNVQGNDRRKVFKPVLEYQIPGDQGKKSLKIDGQVIKETQGPNTKFSLEGIKVNLPSNEVVDVNGHVALHQQGFDADIKAKKAEHSLLLSANVKDYDGKIEFQNTLNPYVNFKLQAHSEIEKENMRNDIDFHYSGDLKNAENRVTINQLLKYNNVGTPDYGLITKNKLHVYALPLKLKFDAEFDPKKLDIELEGQYVDKKANFDLEARTHIKKAGDYSIKLDTSVDDKGIEAFAKRDIVNADKSNLENYIVVKNVGKYELSGVVLHKTKPNDVNVGAIGHLKVSGGGKNEDIKFDIGAVENANTYSSHAKITRTKTDFLDYLLKINKGNNPNGQLKIILKDAISVNGQFKVTDSDGKGNGAIIVDFKAAQRKIKGDVKFVSKDPVFNADVDIFLNFEKNNNDKIHFSTNSKNTEKLLDSKNKLSYSDKTFELNVHRDGVLQQEGKLAASIELVLPTERVLGLKIDREMSEKDNTVNGNFEATISDAIKRGGPASTLSYKSKITDSNYEKNTVQYEGQLTLKTKDGKNLDNTFTFKNVPHGDNNAKLDFKSDLTGNLLPKPASLLVSVEYIDPKDFTIDGSEKYRVKGTYGNDIGLELESATKVSVLEKSSQKFQEDTTVQLRLPFSEAHDIKWISNVLYVSPENKAQYEYTISQSFHLNADVYKVDASGKLNMKSGNTKIKLLVPHVDPFSLDVSYKNDLEGEKKSAGVDVKTTYGKGKSANVAVTAVSAGTEHSLNIKANAPQAEKLKKLAIEVVTKTPSAESYIGSLMVDTDGKVHKSDVHIVYSKVHPLLDITYTRPGEKQSRLYIKGNSFNPDHAKVDLKIENFKQLYLEATSEGTFKHDNIDLKLTANSEKLGLKNYKVDVSSKDAGNGKRLEVHATNDNKNVFSGSTSFILKEEGPKVIIEGSGFVKVKEDQKSANFKYIRTLLTEGSEQGIENFVNVAIGERSYVAETRVTNLEYKASYVYCEEKKQCAHAELHSKVNVQNAGSLEHTVSVDIDLRKLGFAPEFGLQGRSAVSQNKPPQYVLDVHVKKDDVKSHLHVYSTPDYGKFPAGVVITLPQRIIALESLISYPTNKNLPFPVKGEVSFNLDKNKAQLKTALRFLLDVTGAEKGHAAIAELGFSHPKLGKEATIKYQGALQRPSENQIKIESSTTVSHPTLGADREAKLLIEASPIHLKVIVGTPIVQVIDLEGSTTLKDNLQQGDLKFSLLEGKAVQVRAVAKDFQYFEFTTGYSEPERKVSVVGRIDPEKKIDISADIILPNEKKNIVHGALFLQDNLVKSDYGISKENFNYFVNALKIDLSKLENRIKELGEKTSSEFKGILQRAEPNFKQLSESYYIELNTLLHEMANDKLLKELSGIFSEIYHLIATIITDTLDILKPFIEKICKTTTDLLKDIKELYEKQIEVELKQLYTTVSKLISEAVDGLLEVVAHFAAIISEFFEKHKPELQELTNTIAEIFKDLTRLIVAQLKALRVSFGQILTDLTEQIKELPVVAMIKEKLEDLSVPDQVLGILEEAYQSIRVLLPTEEMKAFGDALSAYAQKKLRQEKVDDQAELRVIYEKLTVALTSLVQFVKQQLNQIGAPTLINFNALPLVGGPGGQSLPSLGRLPSFSLLSQLLSGDVPDLMGLIRAYRPRSLNPLDELPSKLRAVIVNGQHIFTFDGRHMTFPGSCRYVLALDHVDRNFTLVMQLQDGAAKALLLEDKSGTTVELKDNGQVLLNGASHGFPVDEKDIYAFRMANGHVGLGTTYGLKAFCSPKLEVCYFEVSGFYLGKLRGLLGDGNNEPYDDFRLPNGKIVSSEAEFGNAYRLASSCPPAKTPEHSVHQHHSALPAACEVVFGGSSPLRPLAVFLDISPFRQACIHAVTGSGADAQKQACDLARGYAALAVTGLLPALLPSECVRCTDGDKPREVGDSYELTLPGKQADIIVAVETTKVNEKTYKDLVVPLVSQIVDGLKGKHIDDIKVFLVGVTSKMPYPILYDTDNKLKGAKIKFDDESRYENIKRVHTSYEKVDKLEETVIDFIQSIQIGLGLTNVMSGYRSIFDLPLRPGAIKHYLVVSGEVSKQQFFPVEQISGLMAGHLLEQQAITLSAIKVTPDLKIGGGKNPTDVVGFDAESVLLVGEKKRGKEAASLRQTLELTAEPLIEFVQSSGGIVFSSTNYRALSPEQQKQFLHSASAAVLERLTHDTWRQQCTCAYVDPFRVRSICINEDRKEARRRK